MFSCLFFFFSCLVFMVNLFFLLLLFVGCGCRVLSYPYPFGGLRFRIALVCGYVSC